MTSTAESMPDPSVLSTEQQARLAGVMREYLAAPPDGDRASPRELGAELDANRVRLIESDLGPILSSYLSGETPLESFKSTVDGFNKRNEYWGFKGIKGQMFFNMAVNVTDDLEEFDGELKAAIRVPESEQIARSRIKTFASYMRRLGEDHVEGGGSKHGRPKLGSIPFFLSYFWQIQDRAVWPVYYTNSVKVLADLGIWHPSGEPAADYIAFKHLHDQLIVLLGKASGEPFDQYQVEHVFWFKGGDPRGGSKPSPRREEAVDPVIEPDVNEPEMPLDGLPRSYVPPVVSILPRIAAHDQKLIEAAKASGLTLDRAFEKHVNDAFTIMGYATTLLGQGKGRVPDGVAIDHDNQYAVIWDAKVRSDGYSMGTDDRTIREYITSQSRDLKKRRSLRNVYYVIVSSGFADDYDDPIRSMKMETDVSEVCLVEAEALVAMVDAKLRDPQTISLGSDGIQRLFSTSGVISAELVRTSLS